MKRSALLPLFAIAVVGLVACGSDEAEPSSTGGSSDALELDGRNFESTSVEGYDLVEGTFVTMSFLEDSLSANAGCNTLAGGYELDGNVLQAPTLAMTMMACDEALMAQDTWLSGVLSGDPTLALDGDTLTITGSGATITMVQPAATSIEGTTWVLTGVVAKEAISSLPADAQGSLTITDGQAAVATGCNTGSGSVEVSDTTLVFGPIATTRMACSPELTELEASVLATLDGEVTYVISGDALSIRKSTGDGEIGLEFVAS